MADYCVKNYSPQGMYQNYGYYSPSYYGACTPQYKTPLSNDTLNYTLPCDTVSFRANNSEQAESPKKKGLSKGAKWGIGLGIALIAGIIFVASRGNAKTKIPDEAMSKLNGLVADGKIDKTYLEIFTKTNGKEGKSFVKDVYDRLAKAMGYDKHKPELQIVEKYCDSSSSTNGIKISLAAYTKNEQQIDAIRHELEHFRQRELIYRAFGREAYIEAHIEPSLNLLKVSDEKCIKKFGKTFKELSSSEIETYKATVRKEIESKLQLLEDLLKEKGTISPTSAEYAEAKKYLQAEKEYLSPTHVFGSEKGVFKRLKEEAPEKFELAQEIYKKYINSELEKGAVREGTKIKEQYKLFLETIS